MTNTPSNAGRLVAIAISAGLIAAFHMGKIPAALPHLGTYFSLSLPESGLIVSSFSLLAASLGLALGMITARAGLYRTGITGLMAVAIGSALGALSPTFSLLLVSRLFEGLGFALVAITMPGIIAHVCKPHYRAIAMGVWGAFIPAAMSIMLLLSPWTLKQHQWQGMWWILAFVSLLWGIIFAVSFRRTTLPVTSSFPSLNAVRNMCTGEPLLVACAFICYSALFAAVTAFLPTYWIAQHNMELGQASRMASIAVTGNIAGNILAGVMVQRGWVLRQLLIMALTLGGVCAATIFSGWLSVSLEFFAAVGFTLFSGMLPGAVFASLGDVVSNPRDTPLFVGMIFQGAGMGQVIGPIGLSAAVSFGGGWIYAGIMIIFIALTGILLGLNIQVRRTG